MAYIAKCSVIAVLLLSFLAFSIEAQTVSQLQQKRILDCTLDSKTYDECDPVSYAIRVIAFAVPGILIAVILFLVCPFYCCGRYCCNCCGGNKQSPNFCCPNDTLPARYSTGDILRPKILGLICFLCALASMTWGLIGTLQLTQGLSDGGVVVEGVPAILQAQIDAMDQQLRTTRFNAATGVYSIFVMLDESQEGRSLKTEATKTRDEMDKLVGENINDFKLFVERFEKFLFALYIIPVVPIFLGLIAALASVRKYLPMCMVGLLFIFGVVLWLFHGAFNAASMVAGDGCAEIHGIARKQLNLMSLLLGCVDEDFAGFRNSFKDLEIKESQSTCEGVKNLCYLSAFTPAQNLASKRIYNCPPALVCTGMTFGRLVELMDTVFYVHPMIESHGPAQSNQEGAVCTPAVPAGTCTISKCQENCTILGPPVNRSSHGWQALELWYNFKGAQRVSNTLDTLGARFSTCDSVIGIFASPFSPPCTLLVDGLIYNRQATGLLGLAVIGGIFILAWGAKRFIPLDEAEKAQRDNDDDENKEEETKKVD